MTQTQSFDEWFARVYPAPQPPGVKETAMIAWNAGVHAAAAYVDGVMQRMVHESRFELAALARDLREELKTSVARRRV